MAATIIDLPQMISNTYYNVDGTATIQYSDGTRVHVKLDKNDNISSAYLVDLFEDDFILR